MGFGGGPARPTRIHPYQDVVLKERFGSPLQSFPQQCIRTISELQKREVPTAETATANMEFRHVMLVHRANSVAASGLPVKSGSAPLPEAVGAEGGARYMLTRSVK